MLKVKTRLRAWFLLWWSFMTKFEPNLSVRAEAQAQPRHLRAFHARSPHQKNPLHYFEISPAEFLFLLKGGFWWSALPLVAEAARL